MGNDIQESLITYFYDRLTDDNSLKTTMGGAVRCYLVWAKTDAALPYLTHRLDIRAKGGGIWPERMATYTLDIWSFSPSASEAITIRKRVVELLDQLLFNTADVKNCYIELISDGPSISGEPDIWHYSLIFDLHFWRQTEAVYILNR